MTDLYPHTLRSRAEACVADAERGMACLLKVQPEELDEARRLVGDSPVIVATHEEAMAFLQVWLKPLFGRGRR